MISSVYHPSTVWHNTLDRLQHLQRSDTNLLLSIRNGNENRRDDRLEIDLLVGALHLNESDRILESNDLQLGGSVLVGPDGSEESNGIIGNKVGEDGPQ